jgi:hypothetical protein
MKKNNTVLLRIAGGMIFLSNIATVSLAGGLQAPSPKPPSNLSGIDDTVGNVLGVIQWIGIIVAVAMIMYVGIKYMTSTAGKKAEAKETMVPVLIGAALLALAPTVVKAVYNAVQTDPNATIE